MLNAECKIADEKIKQNAKRHFQNRKCLFNVKSIDYKNHKLYFSPLLYQLLKKDQSDI